MKQSIGFLFLSIMLISVCACNEEDVSKSEIAGPEIAETDTTKSDTIATDTTKSDTIATDTIKSDTTASDTSRFDPSGMKVLWLGTSIPAGCEYPQYVCQALNMECVNKSVGASYLCFDKDSTYEICRALTARKTETKDYANYDNLVAPFIADADYVVVDHGYNDGENIYGLREIVDKGRDAIDWNSEDRSDFIGAFNYLYNRMKESNPDVKVIVGGYFQNNCTISYTNRGYYISVVLEWIADHYNLPILDAWNYVGLKDGYAPDSQDYIQDLNDTYGTDFTKKWVNEKGEITYFQIFCPDAVHPFSDPTGHSDSCLNKAMLPLFEKAIYQ